MKWIIKKLAPARGEAGSPRSSYGEAGQRRQSSKLPPKARLASGGKAEEIIKILLKNRGLRTKKEIDDFLNPLSPLDLSLKELGISKVQLAKAVNRIKKAIKNNEEMVVWGDYDADGLCGTAILWETIYNLGGKVMPYIPDRVTEGYGLNKKSIKKLKAKSSQLKAIITVDHGITAHEKINYARELGLDVIVTDHHQLGKTKPKAYAVVHSIKICGAAVAWILAKELTKQSPHIPHTTYHIPNYLDLVAIGTIADLMPLVGSNRSFAKFGLERLNQTKRAGLLALFEEAGLKQREIDTYQVGWIIGPRLNASGRITKGLDSLRLLCTKDAERAKELASKLNRINRERQNLLEQTFSHAEKQVLNLKKEKLIFISDESYHEGIIGLVAGRLAQKFYRPAVVISEGKTHSKASARSINGFDIIKAIRQCDQHLVDSGGHPMAAGFTVETKKLKIVGRKLLKIAQQALDEKKLIKTLKVDYELRLSSLTFKLYEAICRLAPFGIGNPEPVFTSCGLKVLSARLVGKNKDHLKLLLDDPKTPKIEGTGAEVEFGQNGHSEFISTSHPERSEGSLSPLDGIGFGLGETYSKLAKDKLVDVAYNLSLDEWNNQRKLQLKIKDIRNGDGKL